jgi:hypothetical protein
VRAELECSVVIALLRAFAIACSSVVFVQVDDSKIYPLDLHQFDEGRTYTDLTGIVFNAPHNGRM